jgi:hypothetical protein
MKKQSSKSSGTTPGGKAGISTGDFLPEEDIGTLAKRESSTKKPIDRDLFNLDGDDGHTP